MPMPLLMMISAALASQEWGAQARSEIPDRLSIELALEQHGVLPEEASYLSGHTWWRTDEAGQLHRRQALGWFQLTGRSVVREGAAEPTQQCASLSGRDPVPGGRQLLLYRSAVTDHDREMDAALAARPGIVLASSDTAELAMVSLRPGDQVFLIDIQNNRTGRRAERLELQRGESLLQLTRDGSSPQVCYSGPQ